MIMNSINTSEMNADIENITMNSSFGLYIDEDEVDEKIICHLNSVFKRDIRNLVKVKGLVEELTVTQNQLKDRLLFATCEAPDKITKAIKEAETVLSNSCQLEKEYFRIDDELSDLKIKHRGLLDTLTPDIKQYKHFKKVEIYQKWIHKIKELSNQLQCHLTADNETEMMVFYDRLKDSVMTVMKSQYYHLTDYCSKTLSYWYEIFNNKFEKDIEKELKIINWPFTSSTITIKSSSVSMEATQRLELIFGHLLRLELPENIIDMNSSNVIKSETDRKVPLLLQDFVVSLMPIKLLLKPLELRFLFHFSGSKATNSRNNPEWYLTQVLNWIGVHESFIETRIQPILYKNNITNFTAKVEFMRGLVRLVVLKLLTDLPEIEHDEDLFCQTIQGTLNFERELRLRLNYPTSQPSVLVILTQPSIFKSWISIERKFAMELMDEFVSSKDAWKSEEYEGATCHCGEQLILLLQGIADRYKPLPQPGHRMQFLELQLELLDDFRVRVLQMTKSELHDPLQSEYCSILNTVNHIQTTLADWSDLPFYVEMQYYREKFNCVQKGMRSAQLVSDEFSMEEETEVNESAKLDSFISAVAMTETTIMQDALKSLNDETKKVFTDLKIAGSVFDEIIDLYCRIECEMLSVVTEHVLTEIRARSQSYRKDKWFVTPSTPRNLGSPGVMEVSPSLCILLQVLVKHLNLLKQKLSLPLFTQFSEGLASHLNKFIYEEVILQNNFSQVGAAQLKYDMTRAIFPIFGEYHPKPDIFFPNVKDCLILLTLARPTALLLRETLKPATADKEFCHLMTSPVKALEERSVVALTVREAEIVLNLRTNMAS